jgi:cytochrome c biogenesis protein CcdA
MKIKTQWIKVLYIIGIVAIIIGVLDPMEGSVVILAGSVAISFSTFLNKDRHWKLFLVSFLMIVIGVFFLFYLSSRGGFGGNASLSWWWGLLILPYPTGWLLSIALLVIRAFKKKEKKQYQ